MHLWKKEWIIIATDCWASQRKFGKSLLDGIFLKRKSFRFLESIKDNNYVGKEQMVQLSFNKVLCGTIRQSQAYSVDDYDDIKWGWRRKWGWWLSECDEQRQSFGQTVIVSDCHMVRLSDCKIVILEQQRQSYGQLESMHTSTFCTHGRNYNWFSIF